jgi:hypothetical protein
MGRDSVVGIATRYGLDSSGIESWWGARFSAPVQTDPGAHPASYTMGTRLFPGVMRPGRGVNHPPPSSAKVKERVELLSFKTLKVLPEDGDGASPRNVAFKPVNAAEHPRRLY